MAIQPVFRDDNGLPLTDKGSELFTKRFVGISTAGLAVSAPVDLKEVVLHIEGSTVKAKITGSVPGSEEISWTSDGVTLPPLPVVKAAGEPICTITAPSETLNVSLIAWR